MAERSLHLTSHRRTVDLEDKKYLDVVFSRWPSLFPSNNCALSPWMSLQSPSQPIEYDPRIGDEDGTRPDPQEISSPSLPPFHGAPKQEFRNKGKSTANRPISSQRARASRFELPDYLHWIIDNWRWSKWKPAIRCAISEWASLLLLIIGPSRRVMGQVCFVSVTYWGVAFVYTRSFCEAPYLILIGTCTLHLPQDPLLISLRKLACFRLLVIPS